MVLAGPSIDRLLRRPHDQLGSGSRPLGYLAGMPSVVSYHRPATIDQAAILLATGNARAVGGGTVAVPDARTSRDLGVQVVDLQAIGLDAIGSGGSGRLRIGAMVPVGQLIDDERMPALLRDLARRELPSTLRHQATVGGLVAGRWHESALLAGLLVHDAVVELHGEESQALADYLAAEPGPQLITGLTIDPSGSGASAGTGRTPADVPIVGAVARRTSDSGSVAVALTGVASTPVLADPADVAAACAGVDAVADFRGSADYRRHLARTLTARAVS